jgi:hypothetical protein
MTTQERTRICELLAELHTIIDPVGPTHAWSSTALELEEFAQGRPPLTAIHRTPKEWIRLVESLLRRWGMGPPEQGCCTLAFKTEECGYQGDALWCDKSLPRCQALGNVVHFKGQSDS